MNIILSIAGSDSIGGAGIQADLKTITAHGAYGMTVVTTVTSQNTRGVYGIKEMSPELISGQIGAIFEEVRPNAIKIGMLSSEEVIKAVSEQLEIYKPTLVVLDPVMVATSGARLLKPEAIEFLQTKLLPIATVITPNIQEAEVLWGNKIKTPTDMEDAATDLGNRYGNAVLLKGGHFDGDCNDVLFSRDELDWYNGKRIHFVSRQLSCGISTEVHGTGCTLSTAIACQLGAGNDLKTSIFHAKAYVTEALKASFTLGHDHGLLDHCWKIRS